MLRTIIKINHTLCNGCGLCAKACHEGAIVMQGGKATLTRDDYCDGLGNCLPVCPTGALSFEKREAAPFDAASVQMHIALKKKAMQAPATGPVARTPERERLAVPRPLPDLPAKSELAQWPVQIQLVPADAPYFSGADLLIAADCTAFAYAGLHTEFMHGKVTLIGCPKLDAVEYQHKLAEILATNDVASITVVRMEVPCCAGLARAAFAALEDSALAIPWKVVTISTEGKILHEVA